MKTRRMATPRPLRYIPPDQLRHQAVRFEDHQALRGCAAAIAEFVVFSGVVLLILAAVVLGVPE
jgi:hypothetical protein